jgi:glycogen(starch) synthase
MKKLFAALGPGDMVAAHRQRLAGGRIKTETSVPFSDQLVDWCKARRITLLGVGYNPRADEIDCPGVRLEQRAKPFSHAAGLRYHIGNVLYAWHLAIRARRFGADVALIDSGTAHYFALLGFRLFGIPVAVNFHNVLWAQGFKGFRRGSRILDYLNGRFFRAHVFAATGCSPECGRQVAELAGRQVPFFEWRAQFDKGGFPQSIPDWNLRPFRVLFSGRVEANKGALDIPAIAAGLERRLPGLVRWDICGDGGVLDRLRSDVQRSGLADVIRIHGRLDRARLLQVYGACHAIVVPTRGDFCEGLPLVCAEAVICQRPIVTSRVSNALPVLGPAIAETIPEDIESYIDAIARLATDRGEFERLRDACVPLREQFFDATRSYPAAIDRMMSILEVHWKTLDGDEEVVTDSPPS